jgi:thioredoxin-related protein
MSKVNQKIELLTNVLIIVVAVLLIGILAQKYFLSSSLGLSSSKSLTIGNKVSLPDVDWSKSNKNVLLVLQRGCRFCTESAEFYKNLIQQTQGKNVNIIAVLPQNKVEAEEYLKSLGISGIEIRQSQLDLFQVSGTPTIIIANDKGEISNFWEGQLLPAQEIEVINQLIS